MSNRTLQRSRRRGIQTLEAILVLPLLLIASLAVLQFGASMLLHQAVNTAAVEAAREASKIPAFDVNDSVDMDKIEAVVEDVLGAHGMDVGANSGVLLIVEQNGGVACRGDETNGRTCPMASTVTDPQEIQVTVVVLFDDTPVPNLMRTFGFDRDGSFFEACSLARRE